MRNKSSQVTTALHDHHQYYVTVPVLLPASMLVPLLVPISLSVPVQIINPLVPAAILVLAIIVVNIARIANAVQVTICLLVSTNVY